MSHSPVVETAGAILGGRYKLVEHIGIGGMGDVWSAMQTEPVRRTVAVKLIKRGMESAQVLARFEAERQALAVMDHPNIAKVLDGGIHEGRPYFVMELVKGVPITDFCDQHRLTPRQRLELFIPVCEAIQHAHQKGVIHRDIKPNNVLVGMYDTRAVPKVIDFGIAKATTGTLTEATLSTGLGQVIGTPQYMSPEQATLDNVDIDTRTDVYSLGVLLYELLTGTPPFSREELDQHGLLEVLRVVREVDPPKPSTKLSTAHALPSLSANRGTEPRKLTGLLRNELDWIVMKALEKDRARRYETANGLAVDIHRYLNGEAVVAHPPSATYRFRKLVRRNKGTVLAASLIVLALLGGIAGTTWGLFRAREAAAAERLAKDEADAKRREAAEQARLAKDTGDFLRRDVLRLADPNVQFELQSEGLPYDPNLTLRDVVVYAAQHIDGKFPNSPLAEADIRAILGATLIGTGRSDLSVVQHERARALYTEIHGPDHITPLGVTFQLARGYAAAGRHADAMELRQETLDRCERVHGAENALTLATKDSLAGSLEQLNRFSESIAMRNEVIELRKKVHGPEHEYTLQSMNNLAATYSKAGRRVEALALQKEVLAIRRRTQGDESMGTMQSMNDVATSLDELARHDEALELREEAWALQKRKLGVDHPKTLQTQHNLAVSYDSTGRIDEAFKIRLEMSELQKSKLGADHPDTLMTMATLANSYAALGRVDEALKIREETFALQKAKLGAEDVNTLISMQNLANSYEQVGRHEDAYRVRIENLALRQRVLGLDHPHTLTSMWNVIGSLVDLKQHDEALIRIQELLDLAEKAETAGKPPHPQLAANMLNYRFRILFERKDIPGCRATIEAYEALPQIYPWLPYNAARYHCRLVSLLDGRPEEANAEADRAIALLRAAISKGHTDRAKWETESDFEPIRSRADFVALVESLDAVPKK